MSTSSSATIASLLACVAAVGYAQPKEVPIDATLCWGGTAHVIAPAQGSVMGTYQLTGPMRSAEPGGAFDGASFECVGTFESLAGDFRSVGYCVSVDKQGDKAWGRDIRTRTEDTFEYLGGTGKYAGMSGTATKERPGAFPAARPGSVQGCSRILGKYRLP
ncbi:MAG TPA: hypothetical protein VIT02_08920 [Burkholderiaceae bacterium]